VWGEHRDGALPLQRICSLVELLASGLMLELLLNMSLLLLELKLQLNHPLVILHLLLRLLQLLRCWLWRMLVLLVLLVLLHTKSSLFRQRQKG
jgi:hypothetical protein